MANFASIPISQEWWQAHTKNGFSLRWYKGEGTSFRTWENILFQAMKVNGINIYKLDEGTGSSYILDTRRVNRHLRKIPTEN
jgi:hypothetical protein